MSHGETTVIQVKAATAAGRKNRRRFLHRATSPNGTASTTSEVLIKAANPIKAPVIAHREAESECRRSSMHQNNAAASRAVTEVSQTLVTVKKMLSGKTAHTMAATFPGASPVGSRPPRGTKKKKKSEKKKKKKTH